MVNTHDSQTDMTSELLQRAQSLSDALIDGDEAATATHQDWLMGEVAAALLHQEGEKLMELRAAIADLAPLADHYGNGKRGDRWRAVWELLYAISKTTRPLEQRRLAAPERLSGRLLRLIGEQAGITPSELARHTAKSLNHVSNTLRLLADQGLVQRLPHGKEVRYYLSGDGHELLGAASAIAGTTVPAQPASPEGPAAHSPRQAGGLGEVVVDIEEARMKRAPNPRTVPGHYIAQGGGR